MLSLGLGHAVTSRPRRATRRMAQIRFGSATATSAWNSTSQLTTGVVFSDLLTTRGESTGWGFTLTDAGSANAANGSLASRAPFGFPFPPVALQGVISDTVSPRTVAGKYTGLDDNKTYRIQVACVRQTTAPKNVDVTVGGVTVTIDAAASPVAAYAEFAAVSPSSGEIAISVAASAGNSTAAYLCASTITEL